MKKEVLHVTTLVHLVGFNCTRKSFPVSSFWNIISFLIFLPLPTVVYTERGKKKNFYRTVSGITTSQRFALILYIRKNNFFLPKFPDRCRFPIKINSHQNSRSPASERSRAICLLKWWEGGRRRREREVNLIKSSSLPPFSSFQESLLKPSDSAEERREEGRKNP